MQTIIRRLQMNNRKQGKKVFRSLMEFEKAYFPKAFEREMMQENTDAESLGAILAKQTLERIETRIDAKNNTKE